MGKKTILFFADSSQETSKLLNAILKVPKNDRPLLAGFLEKAHSALRVEWDSLPSSQRAALPKFQGLETFIQEGSEDEYRHPALHLAEVVLVQLAYFINAYELAPKEPYPDQRNSICVGVCVGELAAAAVALSESLIDLIPLAVDAVRLAFRAGLLVFSVGNDIEPRTVNQGSWALNIPKESGAGWLDNLVAIQDNSKIPPHKRAWLSALGNNTVTLAGPPSTLDAISAHLVSLDDFTKATSLRRLSIYGPYHADHIFSKDDVKKILSESDPLSSRDFGESTGQNERQPLVGGFYVHEATAARAVFESVLQEILAKPIDWKTVNSTCKDLLDGDVATSCQVRTFGPDIQGHSLATGLQKTGANGVAFDPSFSRLGEESGSGETIPLAIVGVAGRFPSANSPDEFWTLLREGVDCVQEVPDERFDKSVHFKDKIFGCFIEKPGLFDPRFFRMSPREATNTDPAHRIGLTTVQEAMDMAGLVPNSTPSTDAAKIGTFWGNATEEYKEEYMSQHVDSYYIPGSSRAFAPGRVNFIYNFDGPAVSFDTACSSSMIALNHACNSVWNGDCSTAIVVGSNILTAPFSYKGLDLGHFLSKTGGCKSFDEFADGYCRGEAVATIIIKKLTDAVAERDNILGVIRAISTNHSSNSSSITRPHGPTQETLFRRLLKQANLKPTDISYVEMHGTGTQAGDTVEMTSVTNVLAPQPRSENNPLYIGAVKANVGHGEGASGITSLVKSLLMLREQKIPPHVGIKSGTRRREPDVSAKNVQIASQLQDWKASAESQNGLRRVLISNFSAAGGNTSMILEEYNPQTVSEVEDSRSQQVIAISGKSEKALRGNMENLLQWLKNQPNTSLSDLSYTTTVRRMHYDYRYSIPASSVADLEAQLGSKAATLSSKDYQRATARVVFSGYTNTRSPAMKELFSTSDVFREEVSRLDRTARRLGYETILPFFSQEESGLSFIQRQLSYVVAQIAMYKLVTSWGVKPVTVTGHSLGEYVALCASGIISPDDLVYIVGCRAKELQQKCELNTHGMLAVRTSLEEVQTHLQDAFSAVEVSCINSPSDIVLSGSISNLEKVEQVLADKKIQCTRVDTPLAFHSSQMDAVIDELSSVQTLVKFADPHTPLLSPTEKAKITSAGQLGPDYLKRHTRGIVDFYGALQKVTESSSEPNDSIWLEIGPHGICSPMIKLTLGSKTRTASLMRRDESIWSTVPKALSLLYNGGQNIDWKEYHRQYSTLKLLHLPSHVLEEQHYWLPQKKQAVNERIVEKTAVVDQPKVSQLDLKLSSKSVHKLASRSEQDGLVTLTFETDLTEPHLYEIMRGHMMNGSYLCPASLYTDIALTIGQYLKDNELDIQSNFRACVSALDIHKPIIGPSSREGASLVLRIVAHTDLHDQRTKIRFETKNSQNGKNDVHAQCQVYFDKKQDWLSEWSRERESILRSIGDLEAKLFRGLSQKLLSGLAYRLFDSVVVYGDKFRSMREIIVDDSQLQGLASIDLYRGNDSKGYACCPYWMDGLAHLAGFLINGLREGSEKAVYISPGWTNFRLAEPIDPEGHYKSYVKLQDHGSTVTAECYILLQDQIVGKVDNLKFQMLPRSIINRILPPAGQVGQQRPAVKRPTIVEQYISDSSTDSSKESSAGSSIGDSDAGTDTPTTEGSELDSDLECDPPSFDLKAILYEETGVSAEDIRPETEIVDLGIDSLLSLTITDRLREDYHLDSLPSNLFQIRPTFGALESYILDALPKPKRVSLPEPAKKKSSPRTDGTKLKQVPSSSINQPKVEPQIEQIQQEQQKQRVRELIAEQMGLGAAELSPTDDLFDLGLDSLMSLEIVEALRENLGLNLDTNFFITANTLQQVESTLFKTSPNTKNVALQESVDTKPAQTPKEKPSTATFSSEKLSIALQGDPNSCSQKLFLFPDGSGAASVYARMEPIDDKTCVYALNSPYLKKGVIPDVDIASLVGQWVRDIQTRQPEGPYHLGGYSSGGYYAYEAAKLLMNEGQAVDTLICIDTPSRNVYDALPEDVLEIISGSGVVSEGAPTPAWLVDHFRSSIPAISNYTPTPMSGGSQPKTYLIWASDGISDLAKLLASKGKFNKGIVKFFAGQRGPLRPHGWAELIRRENIKVAQAPGNHFSIVSPRSGNRLRDLLAAAITQKDGAFESLPGASLDQSWTLQWKPACESMSMEQLYDYMSRKAPSSEISLKRQLNTLVSLYVQKVLNAITESESRQLAPHFQRFYRWMQDYAQRNPFDNLPDEDLASLETDVAGTGVDGALLSRIGHNILPILQEKAQALGLMLENKLLFAYYPDTIHTKPCFAPVELLIRRQLQSSRPLNILEIGAGTGGTTKAVFRAISDFEKSEGLSSSFGHYTYTDVSAGFFKQAKDTFKPFVSNMTFKKLDIEQDPSLQGFEHARYDLVVASQCLHATKNMRETMKNVRFLLKPGGKIIMVEGTREAPDISFIFGTLPGWWLGVEDIRQLTPCLDVPQWVEVLRDTGFNGTDLVVPNCDSEVDHSLSVIMSTAV